MTLVPRERPELHLSQTRSRVEEEDHALFRATSGNHTKCSYLCCIGPNICPRVALRDKRKQPLDVVAGNRRKLDCHCSREGGRDRFMTGNWEFLLIKILRGASEMAQQLKVLTATLCDRRWIPRISTEEGEVTLPKCPLISTEIHTVEDERRHTHTNTQHTRSLMHSPTNTHAHACTHTYIHTHTKKNSK